MCGICGAWLVNTETLRPALEASLASIRHRGPDDQGLHLEQGVALGIRRLAIIDVEGGKQPLWNENGEIGTVFNGEIYNYQDLLNACHSRGHQLRTRSDTEAIVHLYEDDQDGFVRRLRGMFAIAVFDRPRKRLLLARDRFGKKPLYYVRTPRGGLLFASELKALLPLMRSEGMLPEIDPQGIYDFLSLGSVPQPSTVYRGVMSVPPGSLLIADGSGIRLSRYWEPEFAPKFGGTYREAQLEAREKIREAVRLRLRSDVPLGTFLSAGVDSSIVTFEAAQVVGDQLRTFTVASDDATLDESAIARRSAERLGVQNLVLRPEVDPVRDLEFLVRAYDQPFADPSAIPSLEVSRAAREHVTVVLNGDGGDELFGGYRRHVAAQAFGRLDWIPRPLVAGAAALLAPGRIPRRTLLGYVGRMARGLALPPEERYLVFTSDMLRDADKRPWWSAEARATESLITALVDGKLSAVDQQVNAELGLNLPSSLLVKMDIATSAYSLEGRSPLLDHELAEFALRLPGNYKVRARRPKAILRDAYSDALAPEVTEGKKRGFEVPLDTWLQGPWRPMLQDTLGARDARVLDFVDSGLVTKVLEENSFQERNKAYITYAFLVLELWLRSIGP